MAKLRYRLARWMKSLAKLKSRLKKSLSKLKSRLTVRVRIIGIDIQFSACYEGEDRSADFGCELGASDILSFVWQISSGMV